MVYLYLQKKWHKFKLKLKNKLALNQVNQQMLLQLLQQLRHQHQKQPLQPKPHQLLRHQPKPHPQQKQQPKLLNQPVLDLLINQS